MDHPERFDELSTSLSKGRRITPIVARPPVGGAAESVLLVTIIKLGRALIGREVIFQLLPTILKKGALLSLFAKFGYASPLFEIMKKNRLVRTSHI